jgi:hypothetical protein
MAVFIGDFESSAFGHGEAKEAHFGTLSRVERQLLAGVCPESAQSGGAARRML